LDQFDPQTNTFKHLVIVPNFVDAINTIYEDHIGVLWLGTALSGLKAVDRQTGTFTQHYQHNPKVATSLGDNEINAITEDAGGALWVATKRGVDRFDRATQKFLRFQHDPQNPAGLNMGVCSRIYKDRSGLLWIETDGSGLNKFDPRPSQFAHFKHEPDNPSSLSKDLPKAICEDRFGDLWIGMVWGALDRLDRRNGKMTYYRHDPNNAYSLGGKGIFAIYEDQSGDLWIGGDGGLNRFDRELDRFDNYHNDAGKRLGLTSDLVAVIGEDHAGNLWLGADILRNRRVTSYARADHPKQNNVIHEDRQERLWIGTSNGLYQFHHDRETFTRYFHDPANPNSLGHNFIKTIFEDRAGNLWIGTTDGLNKFNPETETFIRYHEKDGLPNTFIYGILGDPASRDGNLWMSTNRGLSKLFLSGAEGFNPATGKFRNYDLQDGLQSYEFNTGAYHRSKRTGEMFFGGINGINIFHPDSVKDSDYLASIVLTDFKKFDLPVQLEEEISEIEEIKLAYQEDVFSFEFAALDFTHPEKNQYAYMLEGFDHDWVYCGTRRFARYTNLDPGTYTFRVKGTNHDGVWNEQGASVRVVIVPPFWMTWWFRIMAIIVVLGAVAGAAKYISVRTFRKRVEELERQQALENERKRISKDMHDELGANLTKIAILSELAQKNVAAPGRLQTIIWAINPQHNTLDGLAAYLRKYAANYLELTPVRYRLDFPETVPGHPLSAEFRRHIFMVVKEALHNVVKHAQATEVEMKLGAFDHTLEITIQDNGKGFCPEILNGAKGAEPVSGRGNGVPNMNKRITEVGGRLEIKSQPQHGTTIKICAKIT
jgi:signal transduction histidine kinase/streptogramin lyase